MHYYVTVLFVCGECIDNLISSDYSESHCIFYKCRHAVYPRLRYLQFRAVIKHCGWSTITVHTIMAGWFQKKDSSTVKQIPPFKPLASADTTPDATPEKGGALKDKARTQCMILASKLLPHVVVHNCFKSTDEFFIASMCCYMHIHTIFLCILSMYMYTSSVYYYWI